MTTAEESTPQPTGYIRNDYAKELTAISPEGGKARYLALTETAHIAANIPHKRRISPRMFIHTMYCERVDKWLKKAGHETIREHETGIGKIDVYSIHNEKRRAYEIEHFITKRQITVNVDKCLRYDADEIVLVCEGNKGDLDTMRDIILELDLQPDELERITYTNLKMLKMTLENAEEPSNAT